MKTENCGICHSPKIDARCHYCGAIWIQAIHKHLNICTGRVMVRGIVRTFGAGYMRVRATKLTPKLVSRLAGN